MDVKTNIALNEHFHARRREPDQRRLGGCLHRLGVFDGGVGAVRSQQVECPRFLQSHLD
jgi:hypothetical protein